MKGPSENPGESESLVEKRCDKLLEIDIIRN